MFWILLTTFEEIFDRCKKKENYSRFFKICNKKKFLTRYLKQKIIRIQKNLKFFDFWILTFFVWRILLNVQKINLKIKNTKSKFEIFKFLNTFWSKLGTTFDSLLIENNPLKNFYRNPGNIKFLKFKAFKIFETYFKFILTKKPLKELKLLSKFENSVILTISFIFLELFRSFRII